MTQRAGGDLRYKLVCKGCGKEFATNKRNKLYCDPRCRTRHGVEEIRMASGRSRSVDDSVSVGTVGAIHELVVAVDLMRKGFHVFRAQSPACPCDLVCVDGKDAVRIEVRTGKRIDGRRLAYSEVRPELDRFDVLAVVMYDGEIVYHNKELRVISMLR